MFKIGLSNNLFYLHTVLSLEATHVGSYKATTITKTNNASPFKKGCLLDVKTIDVKQRQNNRVLIIDMNTQKYYNRNLENKMVEGGNFKLLYNCRNVRTYN